METNQTERESADRDQPTATEERRDEHQREQVEAQVEGDTGAELKAFLKETADDHVQYVDDIAKDSSDPDRRVNEEQGTTTQPGSEPAERRQA